MSGLLELGETGMPVVGDNPATIRQSWRKLLKMGAMTIYPGNGKPFPVQELAGQLS
jgi:hypothetical protein